MTVTSCCQAFTIAEVRGAHCRLAFVSKQDKSDAEAPC